MEVFEVIAISLVETKTVEEEMGFHRCFSVKVRNFETEEVREFTLNRYSRDMYHHTPSMTELIDAIERCYYWFDIEGLNEENPQP